MPSTPTSPYPLQSAPGPLPPRGPPCRTPLPFQLHGPCLHWSRLSLSPAEPLPSVIRPPDQCRLNIRYPLHSFTPLPYANPLPRFTYHIIPRLF